MAYAIVGMLYHPQVPAAHLMAAELHRRLAGRVKATWARSAWDTTALAYIPDTDLLVCIGGDGTVLRGARSVLPHPIPILGINMGRLGFLTELSADAAYDGLSAVLDGGGRIERRTMLESHVILPDGLVAEELGLQYALNDVAVSRFGGRPVNFQVRIDGVQVEVVRADGVVVSSATGSTGYNLSAGGPVLSPEAEELVLTPIAAHLAHVRPLVLPRDSMIELGVETDLRAIVSFDGQVDYVLSSGSAVRVRRSSHIARFIRLGPPSDFFRQLTQLLDPPQGTE